MTIYDQETGEVIKGDGASDLIETPSPIVLHETGLTVDGDLSFEEWHDFGQSLQRVRGSVLWWIGDWLNYGEFNYGEKYAQAAEETGLEETTLATYKWVSNQVDFSNRFEKLPWYHHRIVAPLAPEVQIHWLTLAQKNNWKRHELKAAIKQAALDAVETPPLPDDKYRCIVIDPPWPVDKIDRDVRYKQGQTLDYPTMSLEAIAELPIQDLAAEDGCHIYLWVTQKYLPTGLALMELWGFDYHCVMTWVKPTGITPFHFMYNTEHVLFGACGGLRIQQMGLKLSFDAAVDGHSSKPDVFYERVLLASPEPRLEMFSRNVRDGFKGWGNEA